MPVGPVVLEARAQRIVVFDQRRNGAPHGLSVERFAGVEGHRQIPVTRLGECLIEEPVLHREEGSLARPCGDHGGDGCGPFGGAGEPGHRRMLEKHPRCDPQPRFAGSRNDLDAED